MNAHEMVQNPASSGIDANGATTGVATGIAGFIGGLAAEALGHRAVRHPYLAALGAGALPDPAWALRDFARHYAGYSAHFPRFLTALISRLEVPAHRAALLQNLAEESGHYGPDERAALEAVGVDPAWVDGVPHRELFARFARAVGAPAPGEAPVADEVHAWRDQLLLLLQAGPAAEAVGALGLGTEQIVRVMYGPLCAAVARHPGLSAADAAFFPLHTAVDDHHQESLRQIAVDLAGDPAARPALRRGMLKALQLRAAFWDWLHARAVDPARADLPRSAPPPRPPALEALLQRAAARRPLGDAAPAAALVARPLEAEAPMYRNQNPRLGIDFSVDRLAFPGLEALDPRVLRVAPGAVNELHRHAHETLFIALEGEGEVRLGDDRAPLRAGEVAFVPRWIWHQTRNTSAERPLVILAITDFGLTSALLGDYDRRTRQAEGGADAGGAPEGVG